jgi:hypothetical protein
MWLLVVRLLGGIRATVFAALATLALSAAGVQTWRLRHAHDALATAKREQAQAAAFASEAARNEEQTRVRYIAGIDAAFERGKADAKAQGERVAADLRSGNLRLSRLWRGCEANAAAKLPGPAADSGLADAADGLREASAGRVVGAVAACQAERDALLGIAEADRAPVKK